MYPVSINIVGHCTSDTARIFFVYDSTNMKMNYVRLAYRETGGELKSKDMKVTEAGQFCYGVFDLDRLQPGSSIEYCIAAEVKKTDLPSMKEIFDNLNTYKFRLLPADRPLKIGVVSCNGVYLVSDYKKKYTLWKELKKQIDEGNVDLLFHVGDQIYADPIWMEYDSNHDNEGLTITDTSKMDELKEKYRSWYMYRSWNAPDVIKVLASCPNIMMWDDHDIYDGYGSNDEDDKPAQKAFFEAAKDAFSIFQVSHNPPSIDKSSFASGFVHNQTGFLVLDGRTNRMYKKSTVLGDKQFSAINKWLAENGNNLRHLFIIAGIPFVHVKTGALSWIFEQTPWTEELTDDLRDSWVSPNNRNECGRLLMILFNYKKENKDTGITILSGDVHVGSLAEIHSYFPEHSVNGKPLKINQVVSSGIGTPSVSTFGDLMMRLSVGKIELKDDKITGKLIKLSGVGGHGFYLSRRNFAIVKTATRDGNQWDGNNVWIEFYSEEGEPGTAIHKLEQVILG